MNKITVLGRITKDIELKTSVKGVSYCRFNIACKSKQKEENGDVHTDFFPCIAWRTTAELMNKYSKKGDLVFITGFMLSRAFKNDNGENLTIWELNTEEVEFIGNKADKETEAKPSNSGTLKEIDDDDIPF